ncbi:MAG: cobyrinate a,c-diamide synthase [Firmicutes bacterium]|nr:cobyrinate a,c-diamide synthase [Bacillota bacterium]
METVIPRVVLAGTNSSCGKTTVTCAVLQALVNRHLKVGAFKCGPDYIDPMFHSRIIGAKSSNLDLFFFKENTLKYLLAKNGSDRDISVIEGVMGFYDGIGMTAYASTYEISQVTQSPVVLVVAAKGASLSVLATIQGFLNFVPDNRICGVILNQCTAMSYAVLAKEIQTHFAGKIRPLGFLPVMPKCSLESRHLGLITAAEVQGLREKLQILAEQAEQTLDLDGLLALAAEAPAVSCEAVKLPRNPQSVRIAVACDNAFCFYYEDSLDVLREMGAELVSFSPLSDTELPSDIHGLYLGGGYPELYAKELSENLSMLSSVKAALELGLPCIAECGGFMYLTESIGEFPMVGFLAGRSFDNGKLTRFGYVNLKASNDTLLGKAGTEIAAHEFHHWDSENPGNSFTAVKTSGKSWGCVHAAQRLYAGYPHFHFCSNPDFAVNFYNACVKEKYKEKYKGETAL